MKFSDVHQMLLAEFGENISAINAQKLLTEAFPHAKKRRKGSTLNVGKPTVYYGIDIGPVGSVTANNTTSAKFSTNLYFIDTCNWVGEWTGTKQGAGTATWG